MEVKRFPKNPIIFPEMDDSIGSNINGPSLIRVPRWVDNPLGKYYLYFSHHHGKYIRLAYADGLRRPWKIFQRGTLRLEQTQCFNHIASPDVHVDHKRKRFVMYFHGPTFGRFSTASKLMLRVYPSLAKQQTFCAFSQDGLDFLSRSCVLGPSYFRVFYWEGWYYALAMPGVMFRSKTISGSFTRGPVLFNPEMRHSSLMVRNGILYVFYSLVGDNPEHILVSKIKLSPDWIDWRAESPEAVIYPEEIYEGADLPLEKSERGAALHRVRQVRDPYTFEENDRVFIFYTTAGESGIAMAEILDFL